MDKSLSGRSILVVEDEMLVLLNIEDMLSDHGCTSVSSAASADQALALIATQSFDAALQRAADLAQQLLLARK